MNGIKKKIKQVRMKLKSSGYLVKLSTKPIHINQIDLEPSSNYIGIPTVVAIVDVEVERVENLLL